MKVISEYRLYLFIYGIIISILFFSCNEYRGNGSEYVGIWAASNGIRFDTVKIINYNENYSYLPYNDDSTVLVLNKDGNLVDKKDTSFVIRYDKTSDELIFKNIFSIDESDIYAKRVKTNLLPR